MTAVAEFELILLLMAAALVLEFLAHRLRVPASALLVLGGVVFALMPGVSVPELDPELMLVLFLPPLLFYSAYFTVWRDFRNNLRIICQLAVGATVFTTLLVGVAAHWMVPGLPWGACFALGAILSPPDAVAAKAVLQGQPLPPRLVTLLEGESLVNDAAGLVLYRMAVAATLTGGFSLWSAVGEFAFLSVGGIAMGLLCGFAVSVLLRHVRINHLIITITFLTAWASYILGEAVEVSGVLATVTAGLVLGRKQHEVFSPLVRTQATAVWNVAVSLLESLVFVCIGLALRGILHRMEQSDADASAWIPSILVIGAVLIVSRFLWIIPSTYLPRFLLPGLRRRDPYPSIAVPVVMSWAGMRGVVSLAVALSVPEDFPGRDLILVTTLALIFVSILVQGTTLGLLIRLMRLSGFKLERRSVMSEAAARKAVVEAALTALRRRSRQPDGTERHPRLVEQYSHRAKMAALFEASGGSLNADRSEHYEAILAANNAARGALLGLYRGSRIHETVLQKLEAELDLEDIAARQALGRAPGNEGAAA